MPKELHEISQFMSGTVTTPSETDITDDTASYSLNIDPIAEDGKLTGVPVDSTLIVHDTTATSVTSASVGAIAFDVTTIVVAATAAFSAPSATDYIWFVDTDGNKMLCGYTGKTTVEFTGVTWLGPGTGGLAISAAVYQAPNATLNIEQIEASEIFGGNTVEDAARIFKKVISGKGTKAQNDVVCANAGLAIATVKKISHQEGFKLAKESLGTGEAKRSLQKLIELSY